MAITIAVNYDLIEGRNRSLKTIAFMLNGKRFTTVNSDAGIKGKIAGYAYWIRSENMRLDGDGKFKHPKKDSNDAELAAILIALDIVSRNEYLRTADVIVVNCDNKSALKILREDTISSESVYYNIWNRIKKLISAPIYYKWVKGHHNNGTSRNWVNNHIDKRIRKYYK